MTISISVVINAYAHEQYVEEAIASVLNQDGVHDAELIVLNAIERFEPAEEFYRKASVKGIPIRVLSVPRRPVGLGLVSGYKAAKNDVIALLDDDDRWKSGKLTAIEGAFEDERVVYFHKGQEFIDEFGQRMSSTNFHRWIRHPSSLRSEGRRFFINSNDQRGLSKIRPFEPEFNNSSICVRRQLIADNLPIITKVARGEDSVLFYCALASKGALFLTTDRLTQYRLHKGGVTSSPQVGESVGASLTGYARDARMRLSQFEQLHSALGKRLNSAASDSVSTEIAFWDVLQEVAGGELALNSVRNDVRRLLGGDFTRPRPREILTALLGSMAFLSPIATRRLLSLWRTLR